MTNNQSDPNQEPNQLADEELEAVAGGGEILDVASDVYEAGKDVFEAGKDLVSDIGDAFNKLC